jgi:hypothetical protein
MTKWWLVISMDLTKTVRRHLTTAAIHTVMVLPTAGQIVKDLLLSQALQTLVAMLPWPEKRMQPDD